MKVKVQEVKRKKGYFKLLQSGLGVAVAAEEDDIPADMVEPLKRIILNWKKKRANKATALSLTFSAELEMHPAVEAAFFQLYKREPDLQHAIDRLSSVAVTLCDESGTAIRSYALDMVGLLHNKYRRIDTPLETFARSEKPKRRRKSQEEQSPDEEQTADAET